MSKKDQTNMSLIVDNIRDTAHSNIIHKLNEELTRLRSELQQAKQEIANHIAVNSLLTDSDGEADLANKLYKAMSELQQKDEVIKELVGYVVAYHGLASLTSDEDIYIRSLIQKAKLNN